MTDVTDTPEFIRERELASAKFNLKAVAKSLNKVLETEGALTDRERLFAMDAKSSVERAIAKLEQAWFVRNPRGDNGR